MPSLNIFAIQPDIVWENKAENFSRIRTLLAVTPPTAGSLLILPEMFSTGFSMDLSATKQSDAREDEAFLAALAREYRSCVIGGVVGAGENERGRNQSVAFAPDGSLLIRYTKIHPFSFGGEEVGHEHGAEVAIFEWGGFKIAPFVCYDLRFPEIFRAAAFKGAELFVVIALWPVKRQQHWLTLLQARAIENQAYVIGVNRVGAEPRYQYAGRSVVVDPHGISIADAGERECVLQSSINPEIVKAWRRDFPALRDAHWRG